MVLHRRPGWRGVPVPPASAVLLPQIWGGCSRFWLPPTCAELSSGLLGMFPLVLRLAD